MSVGFYARLSHFKSGILFTTKSYFCFFPSFSFFPQYYDEWWGEGGVGGGAEGLVFFPLFTVYF
jgi:hypothetical protein